MGINITQGWGLQESTKWAVGCEELSGKSQAFSICLLLQQALSQDAVGLVFKHWSEEIGIAALSIW